MTELYEELYKVYQGKEEAALCTVVNTKGSTPRKAGAKMIVYKDKRIRGTIGGGALEKSVIEEAIKAMQKQEPSLFRHDLLHQHNMCCGGSVDIYIEPVMRKKKLYIFGAGHVGQALAAYARDFSFETVMIDDRKEYLDEVHDEEINKMNLPFNQALSLLPFDDDTYICILTYQHSIDREILAACLKKPYAYLGMIGSRRKVEMTKKMFLEAGIATSEELEKADMPMGIDIHAEGPKEIAISILARLIETRNKVIR